MLCHLLIIIKSIPDVDVQREAFDQFKYQGKELIDIEEFLREKGFDEAADKLSPIIQDYSSESFFNDFISKDVTNVAKSVLQIRSFDKETSLSYLNDAIPKIPGRQYSLLSYAYSLLKENGEDVEKEINILNLMYNGPKDSGDYHELLKNPLETIQQVSTPESTWQLLPLCDILNVSKDNILIYIIVNKMVSPYFEDYKKYINALQEKDKYIDQLQPLILRLNKEDLSSFFSSLGMIDEQRKTQTMLDLNTNGLSEFATAELLEDPVQLIHDLYNKHTLHDTLGKRLHKICDSIAQRFQYDINTIRINLLKEWLEAPYPELTDCQAVFGETSDEILLNSDTTALQTSLFVLRTWDSKDAIKWLHQYMSSACPRAKFRAIGCLFGLAYEEDIIRLVGNTETLNDIFTRCVVCAHAEAYGYNFTPDDFKADKVDETLKDLDFPWVYVILFIIKLHIIRYGSDKEKDVAAASMPHIIIKLSETRKLFLINNIPSLIRKRMINDPNVFDAVVRAISQPFNDLIAKEEHTKPFKVRQTDIFRSVFQAISVIRPIHHLYINGEKIPIPEVVQQLCNVGFFAQAAELAVRITDLGIRDLALQTLVSTGHFDDALSVGFPEHRVFQLIVLQNQLETATEMMVDQNFVKLTNWLNKRNDKAAIKVVKAALKNQGRTKEVRRMKDRFRSMSVEPSQIAKLQQNN